MSQCIPTGDLHHNTTGSATPTLADFAFPDAHSNPPVKAMGDYEVAELAWENGQLVTHCFGFPRTVAQPSTTKYAWDNPRVGGTLESVVGQATCPPPPSDHPPLFHHDNATVIPPSTGENPSRFCLPEIGSSTVVGSCSGAAFEQREEGAATAAAKRTRASKEMSSRSESWHVAMENTCEMDVDAGFTWASHECTSLGMPVSCQSMPTTFDDHDSVGCRPQPQAIFDMKREITEEDGKKKAKMEISSVSTKRSRAAAVHNQSERKRRDKINQRMETLQKLVPNSNKTDKVSVLDEVITYLKQLQAQVQMMSSFPQMMMPMTTMQQLQMSMLAQMGMGMGAIDINFMNRLGSAPAVHPMLHQGILLPPTASWDGSVDRLPPSAGAALPDPFSTLLYRQTMPRQPQQQQQPMTLDAYNRMMALYQQPQPRTAPSGNTEEII